MAIRTYSRMGALLTLGTAALVGVLRAAPAEILLERSDDPVPAAETVPDAPAAVHNVGSPVAQMPAESPIETPASAKHPHQEASVAAPTVAAPVRPATVLEPELDTAGLGGLRLMSAPAVPAQTENGAAVDAMPATEVIRSASEAEVSDNTDGGTTVTLAEGANGGMVETAPAAPSISAFDLSPDTKAPEAVNAAETMATASAAPEVVPAAVREVAAETPATEAAFASPTISEPMAASAAAAREPAPVVRVFEETNAVTAIPVAATESVHQIAPTAEAPAAVQSVEQASADIAKSKEAMSATVPVMPIMSAQPVAQVAPAVDAPAMPVTVDRIPAVASGAETAPMVPMAAGAPGSAAAPVAVVDAVPAKVAERRPVDDGQKRVFDEERAPSPVRAIVQAPVRTVIAEAALPVADAAIHRDPAEVAAAVVRQRPTISDVESIDVAKMPGVFVEPTGAVHLRWLKVGVSFAVKNEPLPSVLTSFGALQGVSVDVSPKVAGTISGRFEFTNPVEFIDILCQNKNLIWYYDGMVVHFYDRSESETIVLRLNRHELMAFESTLKQLGVFDPRYAMRLAENGSLVILLGPPFYVRLVDAVFAKYYQSLAEEFVLEVFPLRNSWATDQSISFLNRELVVPGVATTLQQIIFGEGDGGGGTQMIALNKLKGKGIIGREKTNDSTQSATSGGGAPVSPTSQPDKGDDGKIKPRILPDSRQNAILIWDRRSRMPEYAELIAKLDYSSQLVEIRAAILDVETSRTRDLGVSWQSGDIDGLQGAHRSVNTLGSSNTGTAESPIDFANQAYGGMSFSTIYTNGIDTLMARVRMLETDGAATILSRPAVLTIDNTQAVLEHTETFYVKLQGQEEVDLVDISSGTVLRVTPHIIAANEQMREPTRIKLVVYIEDGSNMDSSSTTSVDNIPRVKRSTISTQAVVTEGQVLVIGGHYNETDRTNESGVPMLKRIPGVGHLFKSSGVERNKTERLFVLAPKIVSLDNLPQYEGTNGQRQMNESPARETFQKPEVKPNEKTVSAGGRLRGALADRQGQ